MIDTETLWHITIVVGYVIWFIAGFYLGWSLKNEILKLARKKIAQEGASKG